MSSTYKPDAKVTSNASHSSSTASVLSELIVKVMRAKQKAGRGQRFTKDIEDAENLLAALPLATEEFGVATNRLANASRYMVSGEFGAAGWELAMTCKSLAAEINRIAG